MAIDVHKIKVTTTGSAASATGSGSKAVPKGELLSVYLDYHASAPASTDVILKSKAPSSGTPPDQTIATVSNANTDAWEFPRQQVDNNAGAAVTGAYAPFVIHGGVLEVSITGGDALTDIVTAYCYIRV
jgi:hypothetical protein